MANVRTLNISAGLDLPTDAITQLRASQSLRGAVTGTGTGTVRSTTATRVVGGAGTVVTNRVTGTTVVTGTVVTTGTVDTGADIVVDTTIVVDAAVVVGSAVDVAVTASGFSNTKGTGTTESFELDPVLCESCCAVDVHDASNNNSAARPTARPRGKRTSDRRKVRVATGVESRKLATHQFLSN